MANRQCLGTIAVMVMALTSSADAQERDGGPGVRVHLENHARVAPGTLFGAESQVARVFKSAGVPVTWATRPDHTDCAGPLTAHVLLLSLGMEDRLVRNAGVSRMVLAQANAAGRRIHVFWSRVEAHVMSTATSVADALGVVIAHELGHVLLPTGSHSRIGIMQENFLVHASYVQRFTVDQSAALRAFVRAHADERRSPSTSLR